MFHLDEPIKAKLTEVRVLSQKDRKPDEEPGAKLTLQMQLSNDALSMLDGALKSTLFTRHAGGSDGAQKPLEDMEPVSDLPNLTPIGQQIGTIKWHHDFAGYELAMQYGTGRAGSNIGSENCQLSNLRITPKEGGTIELKLDIVAPNVTEAMFGKLARLKSREVELALFAPEPSTQRDVEDDDDAPAGSGGRKRQRMVD